jgi:superfamily II DNA or RNA helicase
MQIVNTGVRAWADTWYPWMKPLLTAHLQKFQHDDPEPLKYTKDLYILHENNEGVSFLSGLIPDIMEKARIKGIPVEYVDARTPNENAYEFDYDLVDQNLRYGQAAMIDALVKNDKGVITCCTGAGKSFVIKQLCKAYKNANIVIITKAASVVESLYKDISNELGKNAVGLIKGGTPSTEEKKRIRISTSKSVMRADINKCDILIFDEVHNVGDNQIGDLLSTSDIQGRMFGFSASMHRGDKALQIIKGLFGTEIATLTYEEAAQHGVVTKIDAIMIPYKGPYINSLGASYLDNPRFYSCNYHRNKLIADVVRDIDPELQTLIMVDTLEHAINLHQLLPEYTVIHYGGSGSTTKKKWVQWDDEESPDEVIVTHKTAGNVEYLNKFTDSFGRLMYQNKKGISFSPQTLFKSYVTIEGKPCGYQKKLKRMVKGVDAAEYTITKQEKEQITKDFEAGILKKVIATKIWSEGINVKHCRFFFRANGSASKNDSIQMPGRLSRLMEGKENAVLLDIDDTFNESAKRKAEIRKKEYRKQGWLK